MLEQPLNVVIISKYFTDIFTITKGKELVTMLLYFTKKIFLKHPNLDTNSQNAYLIKSIPQLLF